MDYVTPIPRLRRKMDGRGIEVDMLGRTRGTDNRVGVVGIKGHPTPPDLAMAARGLVSCLTNGWCLAARDFRVQRGASDEQTRRGL